MKIQIKLISTLVVFATLIHPVSADQYATLTEGGSLTLLAGETALITGALSSDSVDGVTLTYAPDEGTSISFDLKGNISSTNPFPLVGPAMISVVESDFSDGIVALKIVSTVQSSAVSEESGTPSTAVVIPSDTSGPVAIILESSTDLITWTAANPGEYGSSTAKRFFRVRAEQN